MTRRTEGTFGLELDTTNPTQLGAMAVCLGPSVPFYRFIFWGGSPYSNRLRKKGYPYSNLSTGGPSCPVGQGSLYSHLGETFWGRGYRSIDIALFQGDARFLFVTFLALGITFWVAVFI